MSELASIFHDAPRNISSIHKIRWLSIHNALDSFLGRVYSVLEGLRQIQASKNEKKVRKTARRIARKIVRKAIEKEAIAIYFHIV